MESQFSSAVMTSEINMEGTENQANTGTISHSTISGRDPAQLQARPTNSDSCVYITRRNYDSLLPFLVVEALSADGVSFSSISVKLSDRGWAWIISGRKLFIWKFKDAKSTNQASKARRTLSPCYELQLPPSDLLHRADLIHVFFMPHGTTSGKTQTVPATIAVSPEGTIRFWSNIANDRYNEAVASDLQGQECYTLAPLSQFEFALGTTTSSVFLLTIDIAAHDARNMLNCSMLNSPESILSGIGRRVTNLFFGSIPNDQSVESSRPLISVIKQSSHSSSADASQTISPDRHLFIMSSNLRLQRRIRSNNCVMPPSQLINAWDLQKSIFDHLINKLWPREVSDYNQVNVWPIDMITTKNNELIILLAALNHTSSNQIIYYAIAKFNPNQPNSSISNISILNSHKCSYTKSSEEQLLSLRFVERRTTNSSMCFLYDRKYLFLTKIDGDVIDAVDFHNQQDSIVGANIVDGHPLLFTQRDGLVSVTTSSVIGFDNPQLVDLSDQESEICYGDDAISKMRSAFQEHNKQDMVTCQHIIKDILRYHSTQDSKNDINEAAFALSLEIIDADIESIQDAKIYGLPESTRSAFSLSFTKMNSIIRFKSDLHGALIDFLKASTLWGELSILRRNNMTISTHFALKEHREKLVVSLLLIDLHPKKKFTKIIEETISTITTKASKSKQAPNIQPNYVQCIESYLKQPSKLDSLLHGLIHYELNALDTFNNQNTSNIVDLVLVVTSIFEEIFRRVQNLRKSNGFSGGLVEKYSQIPWTSQASDQSGKSALMEQYDIILKYGVEKALASATIVDNLESKDKVYTALMNIANWIFEEYQTRIETTDDQDPALAVIKKSYEDDRLICFKPFIAARYKPAAELAEKYRDFHALTRICEACDNQEMLKLYISKFDDFAEYLFNYFLKEGKQNELLATLPKPKLTAFLTEHNQLKWLHQIELKQYEAASVTLDRLANVENDDPERKRTLLSLSKLAMIASQQST